jgi:hypothetical protein
MRFRSRARIGLFTALFATAFTLAEAAPLAAQTVAGTWVLDVALDAGTGQATFVLQVEGTAVTGTYAGVLGDQAVTGSIEGSILRLRIDSPDAGEVTFRGEIEGDTIEGECVYGALGAGTFEGRRTG